MTRIGFHASHEQSSPAQLLDDVLSAEAAGFEMAMCSDHFAPWGSRQGHSGHAWVWLGAALARTGLAFGCVSAPGQRYHPAVHAQAIATLASMFPGRFWVALGSGEALNEHITGDRWPAKPERVARLEECVDVIRRLLRGEEVTHRGSVVVDRAQLYDLPPEPPPLIGPAVSPESAGRVASWADGLVTVNQEPAVLREVLASYRDAGGRGRAALQLHLSWAPTEDEAERVAHDQWRTNVHGEPLSWDIETTHGFDVLGRYVTLADVREAVRVSADLGQHRAWIEEYAAMGFDDIYLHFMGPEQSRSIEAFGEHVLPQVGVR